MKKNVLLLHGWGGSDYPHWQSWLAAELAKDYGTVSFPKLEDIDFPDKGEWKRQLKEHLLSFKPDVVICHSLACILWFHMCNEDEMREVGKLILVAPPSLKCDIDELKTFFPLQAPKNLHAKEALLVTSTTDQYMSPQEAQDLQEQLNIEMIVLENAGHINTDSNYGEWPWILEELIK